MPGFFRRASLILQVAVVLLAGLLVAQFYPLLIYVAMPDGGRSLPVPHTLAAKVEAMYGVLAEAPPDQRSRIRQAFDGPFLRVDLKTDADLADWSPEPAPVRTAIARAINDLGPNFRIVQGSGPGPGILVADLQDGWHMVVEPLPPERRGIMIFRMVGWALFLVVTIAVTIYGLVRLLAPLRTLSDAAEQVGADLHVPHLPEEGPLEVRRTTQAFNRMVDRVRSLVVNRSLMMASISHDLRTMLTRLRLRIEDIPDEAQRAKAVEDIDTMRRTIEANIAFARSEMPTRAWERVDLSRLLSDLADRFRDRDVAMELVVENGLFLTSAEASLDRAISNLVDNATHYGKRVRLSAARDRDGITIVVEDDGPGIPADQREAVLKPFHRLDRARRRHTGGDGLGLAIADAIVRNLRGTLAIEYAHPHGTAVIVHLPIGTG